MSDARVRVFTATYDNHKKKKPGTPYYAYHDTGVLFTATGHIALDTTSAFPLHASLDDMIAKLSWWGKCEIEGLDDLLGMEPDEHD